MPVPAPLSRVPAQASRGSAPSTDSTKTPSSAAPAPAVFTDRAARLGHRLDRIPVHTHEHGETCERGGSRSRTVAVSDLGRGEPLPTGLPVILYDRILRGRPHD